MTAVERLLAPSAGRLHVDADLRVEVDGRRAHLTGSGRRLQLRLEDRPGVRDLQPRTAARAVRTDGVRQLATALATLGLSVDVVAEDDVVARVGEDAGGGLASRLVDAPVALGPGATRPLQRVALGVAAVLAALAAIVRWRR